LPYYANSIKMIYKYHQPIKHNKSSLRAFYFKAVYRRCILYFKINQRRN